MREYQVRFCEGLGVKLPGSTRHQRQIHGTGAVSGPPPVATGLARGNEGGRKGAGGTLIQSGDRA